MSYKPTPTLSGDDAAFDGNVGIGTNTPTEKLTVVGNISATANGYFNSAQIGDLTTEPSKTFEVVTSGTGDGVNVITSENKTVCTIINSNTDANPVGNFTLAYLGTTRAFVTALSEGLRLRGDSQILFYSNNTEIGRFNSSGNLGIGTDTPTEKLTVTGNLAIRDTAETQTMSLSCDSAGDGAITTTGDLYINPKGVDGNGGKVVIDADSFNTAIQINNNGVIQFGGGSTYRFTLDGPTASYIKSWSKPVQFFGSAGYILHVGTDDGNVGINTTTPTEKLTVSGNIKADGLHLDGDFTNYNSQLPDMGAIQTSDKRGYGVNYISNKIISNSKFGRSGLKEDGGFRIETQTDGAVRSQMYLDGEWKTVLTGVTILTDATETPKDIEFTDFKPWNLSLITGDSDVKDINGLPIVQQMTTSMGAIQRPQTINGGTF